MTDLRETRRKLKAAMIVMAAIDVVALGLLFSPLVGSGESHKQQVRQLWEQERQKTRQVEPLRGLDKKVVVASQEIDRFYKDRLPARESAISDQLGKLASENGVKMAQVKYDTKEPEEVGLIPVLIEANCQGDYLQLVKFINALERDKAFFIVSSVVLGDAQGSTVKLSLKLETYLKAGA